jgi:hypothetical protein
MNYRDAIKANHPKIMAKIGNDWHAFSSEIRPSESHFDLFRPGSGETAANWNWRVHFEPWCSGPNGYYVVIGALPIYQTGANQETIIRAVRADRDPGQCVRAFAAMHWQLTLIDKANATAHTWDLAAESLPLKSVVPSSKASLVKYAEFRVWRFCIGELHWNHASNPVDRIEELFGKYLQEHPLYNVASTQCQVAVFEVAKQLLSQNGDAGHQQSIEERMNIVTRLTIPEALRITEPHQIAPYMSRFTSRGVFKKGKLPVSTMFPVNWSMKVFNKHYSDRNLLLRGHGWVTLSVSGQTTTYYGAVCLWVGKESKFLTVDSLSGMERKLESVALDGACSMKYEPYTIRTVNSMVYTVSVLPHQRTRWRKALADLSSAHIPTCDASEVLYDGAITTARAVDTFMIAAGMPPMFSLSEIIEKILN